MNWIKITQEAQLEVIISNSYQTPQVIYKHSTRCGTSKIALTRLEKFSSPQQVEFYFLDIIANRSISNYISEKFKVYHESPQVLLIKNGECIYDESHLGIILDELIQQAEQV